MSTIIKDEDLVSFTWPNGFKEAAHYCFDYIDDTTGSALAAASYGSSVGDVFSDEREKALRSLIAFMILLA
jgi:hypothetical protein